MNESIFKCPVCGCKLDIQSSSLICENNHSFDKSSSGYFNLLLPNQKSSKTPGDSKEMLVARREFLNLGHYVPLLKYINNIVVKYRSGSHINLLDIGCGEGYYSGNLDSNNSEIFGIDISKDGINMASSRYKNINFAVASSYKLPFLDDSIDIVLCIFSPYSMEEIQRVLKKEGIFILVDPGSSHLKSFVEKVTGEFKGHKGNKPIVNEDSTMRIISEEEINYEIQLKNRIDITNLLKMTPYYWRISKDEFEQAQSFENISTEVEFRINILEKIDLVD